MLVVADFSPLRVPTAWVKNVAAALDHPMPPVESEGAFGSDNGEGEQLSQKSGSTVSASPSGPIPLVQVDAHNIVPVWEASPKLEYGARTLRGKLSARLAEFLTPIPPLAANPPGHLDCPPVDWAAALASLQVDRSVPEIASITPGTAAGYQAVDAFIGTVTLPTHSTAAYFDSLLTHCLHGGHRAAAAQVRLGAQRPEQRGRVGPVALPALRADLGAGRGAAGQGLASGARRGHGRLRGGVRGAQRAVGQLLLL
jgi:hypothetical protein